MSNTFEPTKEQSEFDVPLTVHRHATPDAHEFGDVFLIPDETDVAPVGVPGAVASPGISPKVARADHVHEFVGTGGGGGTTVVSYVHNQGTASAVWTITHNLGWYPNVTVIDSGGTNVEGDITQLSATQMRINFSGAFAGIAYLS